MELGDFILGFTIGASAGVTIGMCVPEERKGVWIKCKQKKFKEKWDKYDEEKARLEREREEYFRGKRE